MASLDQVINANKLAELQQKAKTATGLKAKVLANQIAILQGSQPVFTGAISQAPQAPQAPITKKAITKKELPPKPSKNITFLGKTYKIGKNEKYKSIVQVAKELNVNLNDLKQYRQDKDKKRTFIKDNKSIEIDLSKKKPLLLREFGISRISNKQLLKNTNEIKRKGTTIKIYSDVPDNVPLDVFIEAYFWIKFSEGFVKRKIQFPAVVHKNDNIEDIIIQKIILHFLLDPNNITLAKEKHKLGSATILLDPDHVELGYEPINAPGFTDGIKITRNNKGGQTMQIENMILRDDKPPSIKNIYSNIIENGKWKHCIHDFMLEHYGKQYSRKTLEKLNTTDDIYNFCFNKNIKMIAYDINGNCIRANYPLKNLHLKNLFFIAYNNHLYPLKNQYLNKIKPVFKNIEIIEDSKTKILEILENGRYPSNIVLYGSEIVSFIDEETKFINNDQYFKCRDILSKFGIADKIFDSIKLTSIGKLIKDLYITKSDKSLFIQHSKFVKGGFNYSNDDLQGEFKTLDANKFYPSCLKDLKFLITVDMTKDDLQEYVNDELILDIDHYLYIAVPKYSTILMPDTNCYSGEFLKYCRDEGIEFTIIEKLKTTQIPNHYTDFLNDLYTKISDKDFKDIVNPLIGQFENATSKHTTYFQKFVNDDELKTIEDTRFIETIKPNLHMVYNVKNKINIYNRKPIAIQIKDESRKRLYQIMKQLKLNDSNIKSINTDAITYFSSENIPKKMIGKNMGQWKFIDNKKVSANFNYSDKLISFVDVNTWISNNLIANCYAGAGKSYKIINEDIPNCGDDYIVLTPSHSSLKEYRNKEINCNVIQYYEFSNEIPKEKNIFIDELGMVSRRGMHLIVQWYYLGKHIRAYGDFNQLLPINEETSLDSSIFVNSVFYQNLEMSTNYRNNFSKLFYDSIINGLIDNEEIIKKYRNVNSNNVICFTNKTCEKYNRIIANKLGIRDKFAVGARVICNTNELREKNIYNKFIFTVINEFSDYVVLDGNIKIDKLIMNKKEGDKEYFSLAYARTLHSVQGESLPDLYFPNEDIPLIKNNNRFVYTLISRLKGTFAAFEDNLDYIN